MSTVSFVKQDDGKSSFPCIAFYVAAISSRGMAGNERTEGWWKCENEWMVTNGGWAWLCQARSSSSWANQIAAPTL